jgi:hypothetical protein
MAKKKVQNEVFYVPEDPKAVKAYEVYRKHAARLRRMKGKGVVAVGFGLKRTKGAYGFETLPHLPKPKKVKVTYAIIVYVKEKVCESSLPKDKILPKKIDGVPVDVVQESECRLAAGVGYAAPFNPLIGGAPIVGSGPNARKGTAAIAVNSRGIPCYLTCAHVAFGIPPQTDPGNVFQPATGARVDIGPPTDSGLKWSVPVDCALIELTKPADLLSVNGFPGLKVSGILGASISIGKIDVEMEGVVSGHRIGRVTLPSFEFDEKFPPDGLGIAFRKQYRIHSSDSLAFAQPGDSGSLIVARMDGRLLAVGMLIGFTDDGDGVATPVGHFSRLGLSFS